MRVGIIGKGYFGTKIYNVIKDDHEIVFFTGKDMLISYDIDWVIIASSTPSHPKLVEDFLNRGINVFCEKPLTTNFSESLILMDLAERIGVKLYIDDVFLFNSEYLKKREALRESSGLVFSWKKFGTFKDNIVNNLVYHDIYLLLDIMGPNAITNFSTITNQINTKSYGFVYGNTPVYFDYDRLYQNSPKKYITGMDGEDDVLCELNFSEAENNALSDMMSLVLSGAADFKANRDRHRETERVLNRYFKRNKPKAAVIGGGVFGISAAIELKDEFDVTVFESEMGLLTKASSINQYRIHRGYHYPRSNETAMASKNGNDSFLEVFDCESDAKVKSYYCISKERSLVSPTEYIEFLKNAGLEFSFGSNQNLKTENLGLVLNVNEKLFDPSKLISAAYKKVEDHQLYVILGKKFERHMTKDYDYVVNCSYANTNYVLDDDDRFDCQFELCEKPVVRLPDSYKNMSVVIMDGPFMCMDPYGSTGYHVMGNVIHAIHSTNVGKFPEIPEKYKPYMNVGVVSSDKLSEITNFKKFIETASEFFKDMEKSEHIGSMFTVRTVLPKREHDDARPSLVTKHNDKTYSVFSGKITSCVDCARNLKELMLKS